MAEQRITINSIFGGQSPSFHFSEDDQFLSSIAIDPDVPASDTSTDIKTAGIIRPVGYSEFSSSALDQAPLWITTTPKDSKVWVYCAGGDIVSYNSSLASEALERAVGSSGGNGFAYYNNYIYYATNTNIGRYGPLSATPAFDDDAWTTSPLGSQTALTDTTYPSSRHSTEYPNHPMHHHLSDNKLYVGDVVNGQGVLHAIKTTKTTDEGDTNDGSAFNVLDLPFGYAPFAIESYGLAVVVGASQVNTDTVLRHGQSALFFWDTTSPSFSRVVPLPDPFITALKYNNGVLYGWSGTLQGGVRFWQYVGGDTIQTIKYIEEGHPPMQGAVDAIGNRIAWGAFTTYPTNSASVFAYGSKSDLFPRGLHNIARSTVTATASNGLVTALKNVQQADYAFPRFIIGATDGTNINLDAKGTAYQTSVWRSRVYNIGRNFTVRGIHMRFPIAPSSNMTIVPKLFFDNESTSATGTTINSTNYTKKYLTLGAANFGNAVSGANNFFIELTFSGTALLPVLLPIEIELDVDQNE